VKSLTLYPHAKINLGLRILGRRRDGYHELRTRFQTVDLKDDLEIVLKPSGLDLAIEGIRLAIDSSNLVLKAAKALRTGRRGLPGAAFRLRKRIPIAAGLGGGSSDAAATLLGLNRLWKLDLDRDALARLGAGIGADIPFFLHGGTALGTGRGDAILPLPDIPPYGVCLILPSFEVSTAEVYRMWDEDPARTPGRCSSDAHGSWPNEGGCEDPGAVHNDLQGVVFSLHPRLQTLLDRLYRLGATAASVSGSGPSLFGLFSGGEAAVKVSEAGTWGETRVVACKTLSRHEYAENLGVPVGPDIP